MTKRKGYDINLSYNNDFVDLMEKLKEKYPEEVFKIFGIHNDNLDLNKVSKDFFGKSASVADVSIDGNANVKDTSIVQYNYESPKGLAKLNSLYILYKWCKKLFSAKDARLAVEKVINGEVFVNDFTNFNMPYCYAFDLREMVENGLTFCQDTQNIKAPKRSDSFIQLLIQATASISNQIMGACSYPDLFPILDWFYRRELGEDYILDLRSEKDNGVIRMPHELTEEAFIESQKDIIEKIYQIAGHSLDDRVADLIKSVKNNRKYFELAKENYIKANNLGGWYKVKNQFQNLVFSFNFPFRGNQSSFVNLSVMDQGFLESLFDGYYLPDDSTPNLESTKELSKIFFEYFSDIFCTEDVFTFPVMTLAVSKDENGNYIDPDFTKWVAEVNSKKAVANVFQDKPTSFSSCCRLKNDFSKLADAGYQNSFGVGGLSIGSHRVVGINLPRLALLQADNPNILEENLDIVHKILYTHRSLIKERIAQGKLPLYKTNWIHIRRQYSTIGFVGGHEYVANLGLDIRNEDGIQALIDVLQVVEGKALEWEEAERLEGNTYNIEQIPAEAMAVRLAKLDNLLGLNPRRYKLYSNQYLPLTTKASTYDRFRLQGRMDSLTSGGAILHLNVDDASSLTAEEYLEIMKLAKDTGTVYFAINYCYSECEHGHFIVGKHDVCPVCGGKIICQYTRVVGFITPVSSWNPTRRDYEFPNRMFYTNGEINEQCS